MNAERVRNKPVGESDVPFYSLVQSAPDIPEHLLPVVEEYMNTCRELKTATTGRQKTNLQKKRALTRRVLAEHFKVTQATRFRSVLSASKQGGDLFAQGKESAVYTHGSDHYVYKYSRSERTPTEVEYLQKKYQLLKKLMGKHIPQSVIVYGEYTREQFNYADPREKARTRKGAMTMQRSVRGKTFAQMSSEERLQAQGALREALRAYVRMQWIVGDACLSAGLQATVLPLRLDVGFSQTSNPNSLLPAELALCDSPNMMYDAVANIVYFVDLGSGNWNADAEAVFKTIISQPNPAPLFSSESATGSDASV